MSNPCEIIVKLKNGETFNFDNAIANSVFDDPNRKSVVVEEWSNGKIKKLHTFSDVESIQLGSPKLENLNEVV